MKALIVAIGIGLVLAVSAAAVEPQSCEVPGYLLFGDSELSRVAAAITKNRKLTVMVLGTGSSVLPGPDGAQSAYPARLEAALRSRLPGVEVTVVPHIKQRTTVMDLGPELEKIVVDEKPDLVVWQAGTIEAMRRTDPEEFRAQLDEGVETLQDAGADVVLVNMQYSPRTETMIAVGAYADNMRWVAQQREIPLFDRLNIMRHWSDAGVFDLYAATKDYAMARRVHDCIGRALAALIIDAARLPITQTQAPH
jgi:GDSL-like Lipase/Acylhydrolase family